MRRRARRRRRRNPSSGVGAFLLAASALFIVLYIGKKLSAPALPSSAPTN